MWKVILSVVLKIIAKTLDWDRAGKDARLSFFDFVSTLEAQNMASIKLNANDRAQFESLKIRRKQLNENT